MRFLKGVFVVQPHALSLSRDFSAAQRGDAAAQRGRSKYSDNKQAT